MQNLMKRASMGAVVGGALLAAGGFGLAHAQPPAQSTVDDAKVNVTVTVDGQQIGVLQDVSLTNAQALAAGACPTAGITAEALQALDTNGTPVPGTCAAANGGVTYTFAQNGPGNSENAPGQRNPETPTSPTGSPTSPTGSPTSPTSPSPRPQS